MRRSETIKRTSNRKFHECSNRVARILVKKERDRVEIVLEKFEKDGQKEELENTRTILRKIKRHRGTEERATKSGSPKNCIGHATEVIEFGSEWKSRTDLQEITFILHAQQNKEVFLGEYGNCYDKQ